MERRDDLHAIPEEERKEERKEEMNEEEREPTFSVRLMCVLCVRCVL